MALTRGPRRSEIAFPAAPGGSMARSERPDWRGHMKLAMAPVLMLGLCASPTFAQQAATEAVNARALAQQVPSPLLVFPPPNTSIRVIGSPPVQPTPGFRVE